MVDVTTHLETDDMPHRLYTIAGKALVQIADRLDADADASLPAWIVLRQTDKYSEAKRDARALREAAREKNIALRREMLRNHGFIVY